MFTSRKVLKEIRDVNEKIQYLASLLTDLQYELKMISKEIIKIKTRRPGRKPKNREKED